MTPSTLPPPLLPLTGGQIVLEFYNLSPPPPLLPLADGQTVLEYYNLDSVNKWTYLGYNALFFIFFFLCTWLIMTFKKYQSR